MTLDHVDIAPVKPMMPDMVVGIGPMTSSDVPQKSVEDKQVKELDKEGPTDAQKGIDNAINSATKQWTNIKATAQGATVTRAQRLSEDAPKIGMAGYSDKPSNVRLDDEEAMKGRTMSEFIEEVDPGREPGELMYWDEDSSSDEDEHDDSKATLEFGKNTSTSGSKERVNRVHMERWKNTWQNATELVLVLSNGEVDGLVARNDDEGYMLRPNEIKVLLGGAIEKDKEGRFRLQFSDDEGSFAGVTLGKTPEEIKSRLKEIAGIFTIDSKPMSRVEVKIREVTEI